MNVANANFACATQSLSDAARQRILRVRGEPLFYADWLRTVFIHFEVEAEALQRDVPFELDLREGRAYVSLVAFTMRHMRPRIGGKLGALFFKPIANHEFLNVRAYVKHGGETGIYFLAEWLSNPLSVSLGPVMFGLPYRFGHLEYRHDHERSDLHGCVSELERIGRNRDHSLLRVRPLPSTGRGQGEGRECNRRHGSLIAAALKYAADIEPNAAFRSCDAGSLDEFLLGRYTAFTERNSVNRFFRIWHPPWPQVPVAVNLRDTSLLRQNWPWFRLAELIGANYSPGVREVWMGRPHRAVLAS